MKKRIVLRCSQTALFDAFTESFREGYKKAKGAEPTEEQLSHGCTYQAEVPLKKGGKTYAQVKAVKYVKPTEFCMDYRSKSYHKIEHCWMNQLENDKVEFIFERYVEQLDANGNAQRTQGSIDSERTVNAGFFEAMNYRRLASALRAREKEKAKEE